MVNYPKLTLQQAAAELRKYGAYIPVTGKLVTDYQKLRDACRALAKKG